MLVSNSVLALEPSHDHSYFWDLMGGVTQEICFIRYCPPPSKCVVLASEWTASYRLDHRPCLSQKSEAQLVTDPQMIVEITISTSSFLEIFTVTFNLSEENFLYEILTHGIWNFGLKNANGTNGMQWSTCLGSKGEVDVYTGGGSSFGPNGLYPEINVWSLSHRRWVHMMIIAFCQWLV